MNYIIKNCDSYNFGCCLSTNGTRLYCQCKDITDCVIKRIVDKCSDGFNDSEAQALASEILQLLEIEECENE